jgi:hypothetical protein
MPSNDIGDTRGCLDESSRVMFIIGDPLAILGVPAVPAVGATSSSAPIAGFARAIP